MSGHAPSGTHALVDGEGAPFAILNDRWMLQAIMGRALAGIGATVLDVASRQFAPQGCSVLLLLAESHASIHTYPEHGTYMVDVFTCGDLPAAEAAAAIAALVGGVVSSTRIIPRGK